MQLTILIPCFNEEDTIKEVVNNAFMFLKYNNISGEVLVIDNNSTDNSSNILKKTKAKVIYEKNQGYGSALITGTKNALGKYVIMADADCSYSFNDGLLFLEKLESGYDLVVGNRFKGKIEKGAMSFSHKYIGNPILSFIGRRLFKIKIGDFHCGLRAYNKEKILSLNLKCSGMEYASEMIIKASLNNLKISEIPIVLHKDHRINTTNKMNSFKDAIRHIKCMISLYRENKNVK